MGTSGDENARTNSNRVKERLTVGSAVGATVTIVAGTVLVNGQPVGAGSPTTTTSSSVPMDPPSTLVTSLTDIRDTTDGQNTLREALATANANAGPDTITFDQNLFTGGPGEIILDGSPLPVRDDVTITGPGRDTLTISNAPDDITVVASGFGYGGGTIYVYGDTALSVSSVTVTSDGSVVGNVGTLVPRAGEPADEIEAPPVEVVFSDTQLTGEGVVVSLSYMNANLSISNSVISGGGATNTQGIAVREIGDVTLTDVELDSSLYAGMYASYVGDVSMTGTDISSTYQAAGTRYSGPVTITDSTVSDSGWLGLSRVDGDVTVDGLDVTDSGSVSVYYADDVDISDVTMTRTVKETAAEALRPGYYTSSLYVGESGLVSISDSVFDGSNIEVYGAGDLTVDNTTVTNSSRGAINTSRMYGDTTITDSTIADNIAMRRGPFGVALIGDASSGCEIICLYGAEEPGETTLGGSDEAGYPRPETTLRIVNSTITGNTVPGGGVVVANTGGFAGYGYLAPPAPELTGGEDGPAVVIEHSTITGNETAEFYDASASNALYPAATVIAGPSIAIDHSIVTDNGDMALLEVTEPVGPPDPCLTVCLDSELEPEPEAEPVSIEYSMLPTDEAPEEPPAEEIIGGDSNLFVDDPDLGELADNGGDTETMLPNVGSPAVDAGDGDAFDGPTTDQRGATRPSGEAPDIGSVERQIDTLDLSGSLSVAEADGTATLTVTRTGAGEGPVSVAVSTTDETAAAGADYTALVDQPIEFADGETGAKDVVIEIATDDEVEADETFRVTLDAAVNAIIDGDEATVTITDSTDTTTTTTTTTTTVPETTTTTVPETTTTTVPETTTTAPPTTETTTTVAETTTTTTVAPPTVSPRSSGPLAPGGESFIEVDVEHGDGEDPEVTATSSDPSVLEVTGVEKKNGGGSAFTRGDAALETTTYLVRVRAGVNASGTATITVTAEDSNGSSSGSVDVTVAAQELPATGSDSQSLKRTGIIGALLLGLGFVSTLFSRRRRTA